MLRALFSFFCFFIFFSTSFSQIGGSQSFDFLNLATNTRLIGLGEVNVSSSHNDVTMFSANPALLTDSVDKYLAVNYFSLNAGIGNSQVNYARKLGNKGMWGIAAQQLSYGEFDSYDLSGNFLGTFNANDFALAITHSRTSGVFSFGGTLKFAQSNIENYNATGAFLTLGGAFIHPKADLKIGLVLQNIGVPLSNYTPEQEFSMPFDARLGMTFKPDRMPLRFSVTAHRLTEFLNIAYDDPNQANEIDAFGEEIENKISFADKLARHFVFGGEFVFSKNLNFRLGYNFLNRRELQVEARRAMAGFTYGLMVRIKRFEISYARTIRHIAGGASAFSLSVNTQNLIRRRRVIE